MPRIVNVVTEVAERHKVLAGVGIGVVVLAVIIWVPKLSFIQPGGDLSAAEQAKAESDLRGHLLQALAGLVLIVGAYFTGRTFGLNREGQTSERFTRAVEQLANDEKLDVRLGGIYTLERIAHVSKTHHEPALEVLTAFLREHARWQQESGAASDSARRPPADEPCQPKQSPRADFQAAATVLGRRDRRYEPKSYRLVLRGVDLRGALLRGAKLQEARFEDAHLECADLRRAHLEGAHLQRTHLKGARLESAHLERSRMEGAILSGAHLEGAILSLASLQGAELDGATGLTQRQLDEAFIDAETTLPEYLVREPDA